MGLADEEIRMKALYDFARTMGRVQEVLFEAAYILSSNESTEGARLMQLSRLHGLNKRYFGHEALDIACGGGVLGEGQSSIICLSSSSLRLHLLTQISVSRA
jgi:hypothetical protein